MTAEKELARTLNALLRISAKLNASFDVDNLLDTLVEQILELTNAESGCAGLRMTNGMSCSHFLRGADIIPLEYECGPGTGWPDWILTHGTYYLTNKAQEDAVIAAHVRERLRVTCGMSIPIVDSKKDVIAFFEVYNKKDGAEFTPLDLENSLAAAQIASLAIQNALTYRKLSALAAFSRSLTVATSIDEILENIGHHLEINFQRGSAIFLPVDEVLARRFHSAGFMTTDADLEAATRCWKQNPESAGPTILPEGQAQAHYLPLAVRGQVVGVLALASRPGAWFSGPQHELLAGFIGQSALAIERALLDQKIRRLRFLDESNRVQNALLTAVSHEVRTPLAAITVAISGLLSSSVLVNQPPENKLLRTAEYEAKRLHRLVNNLLSVTRLEAGVAWVKLEPCDLSDVIGAALEELGIWSRKRQIDVEISPDLPLVPMDFYLISQVLVNLFSNALKFSAADQPIHLRGQIVNEHLEVVVSDRGIGVPEADLDRVFQKFNRLVETNSTSGLGLGLSICREFVEAHQGQISLQHNPGGGTIVRFLLPLHVSSEFI